MLTAAEISSVGSETDIFAHRHKQTSLLGTMETAYKAIAPVEQKSHEILIPTDNDTHIDLDIKL